MVNKKKLNEYKEGGFLTLEKIYKERTHNYRFSLFFFIAAAIFAMFNLNVLVTLCIGLSIVTMVQMHYWDTKRNIMIFNKKK